MDWGARGLGLIRDDVVEVHMCVDKYSHLSH